MFFIKLFSFRNSSLGLAFQIKSWTMQWRGPEGREARRIARKRGAALLQRLPRDDEDDMKDKTKTARLAGKQGRKAGVVARR
jgi:hypothetical protein